MAGSRTLKLSILADVDDLKKKLGTGSQEVEGFGAKLGDFGKKAGLAFAAAAAAAAAYAGKLLIDGVKAAVEDQAAQEKLASTLRNVTNATDAQIASIEDQILKLSLANGIADDKLRPSFERLTRATKDLDQATKLQTLALDISAGSGKDLESVTNALAKAYEGSNTALSKLGLGISVAELKTMSFDDVTKKLADTFGGQAAQKADTFEGKMARLSTAFDEAKETVGSYVLDALNPLLDNFVNKGIPAISQVADELGKNLKPSFDEIAKIIKNDVLPAIQAWAKFLFEEVWPTLAKILKPAIEGLTGAFNKIKNAISENSEELQPLIDGLKKLWSFAKETLAPFLGGALKTAFDIIGSGISAVITIIARLTTGISNAINAFQRLIDKIKNNPITNFFGNLFGNDGSRGFVANTGFSLPTVEMAPQNPDFNNFIAQPDVTIQVMAPSIIDEEGFSRAVTDALNNAYDRGTGGGDTLRFGMVAV